MARNCTEPVIIQRAPGGRWQFWTHCTTCRTITTMDSFAGLEFFTRVVESGSFTGAAARLQTAKSSVSDSVRALEERLGVRLLERTTRRVRPTEAGRLLYTRCQRLLDEAAAARAEARALHLAPSGLMRVAVPESFGERYILPGLGGFLARFPSVRVELVSGARHTRLVEEEFDLAICIAETPEPALVVRHIGVSKIVIVAAPTYLAARGAPAEPRDLARHACVGTAPPLPWHTEWRVGAPASPCALALSSTQVTACALRRSPASALRRCPTGWWPTRSPPASSPAC